MKRLALGLMRNCGVFALARGMSAGMARVLMYHNFAAAGANGRDEVDAGSLRKQLAFLRRHFHVVPLAEIIEHLSRGISFDRRTVAVTIDDGRRNCYEFFFPLLKEFEIPVTFFVVSSFICREDWLWTDKVLWLSEQPARVSELAEDKIESTFATLNRLRPEKRAPVIKTMATRMNEVIPRVTPLKYTASSWGELREMADSGLVEIGSHSVTHPIFSSITDDESWHELSDSRSQIEEGVGRPVRFFCFPNGKPGDYRPTQMQQVKDAGYAGAVVANFGMVANRANPYELPRIGVSGRSDALSFAKHLDGVEHYQARLRGLLRARGRR